MSDKLKEHDFVRCLPTGETGTIVDVRSDGSFLVELSIGGCRLRSCTADELEKVHPRTVNVMSQLLSNLPCLAFLIGGGYLLMHDHPVAGCWLIAASILSACFPTKCSKKGEENDG